MYLTCMGHYYGSLTLRDGGKVGFVTYVGDNLATGYLYSLDDKCGSRRWEHNVVTKREHFRVTR